METENLRRDAVKLGFIRGGSVVVTMVSMVMLSRALGPVDYGNLSTLLAILPILCIPVCGGIGPLVLRGVSGYQKSSPAHMLGLLRFATFWVGTVSLCVSMLTIAVATYLDTGDLSLITSLAIALLVIQRGFLALLSATLQGLNKVIQSQIFEQLFVPILALLLYLSLIPNASLNLLNVLWAQMASNFLGLVALFVSVSRQLANQPVIAFQYFTKEWLTSLNGLTLLSALTVISSQQPLLLASVLGEPEHVGFLKIAVNAGLLISMPILVMNQLVAPQISIAAKEKKYGLLMTLSKKASRYSLAIALPSSLLLILFDNQIIELIFGTPYVEGVTSVLWIIVLGQLFNVICGPVGLILNMSGREKITIVSVFISLLVTLALSLFLIPEHGVVGAAISATAGIIIWNLIMLREVKRTFAFNPTAI